METEPGEVGGKPRLCAGHPEIGDHRQAQAAADGGAVDGSDDRLCGPEQPVAFDIKMRRAGRRPAQQRAAVAVVAAEIGAGAERFALRGQHQGAAIGVGVKCLERGGELSDQRDVEKIVRRPPDLDQSHVTGLFHGDVVEGSHDDVLRRSLRGRGAAFVAPAITGGRLQCWQAG